MKSAQRGNPADTYTQRIGYGRDNIAYLLRIMYIMLNYGLDLRGVASQGSWHSVKKLETDLPQQINKLAAARHRPPSLATSATSVRLV